METIATSSTTQALFPVPNEQLPQLSTSPSRLQISNKQTEQEKKESKEPMTIPKDYATKHPLHNSWTLWFDHNQEKNNAANWKASLKKIYTFSTVEDFWCLWNNIVSASKIPLGSNYHLFKEGIVPDWEDPQNEKGGKWVVEIVSKQREALLEQLWLFTVLACIGEDFVDSDEICGCVVSLRKAYDRIALWIRISDDEQVIRRIGQRFKEHLGQTNLKFSFEAHNDAKQYFRRDRKSKFEL